MSACCATLLDGGNRQDLSPHFKNKLTYFIAHLHVVQHFAQLDGVLDSRGFFLLHLLRYRHHTLGRPRLRSNLGNEFLEFIVDQLEHAPSGFWVLLNHLHHPLDFSLQSSGAHIGFKPQYART